MLTLFDHDKKLGRRNFLKVGGLALGGLGGMAMPNLGTIQTLAAEKGIPVKDKSVVFLFLHGGPSQIETFDPKMTAPAEIRSQTGEVKTEIPGVTFGGTFPELAKMAKQFSIVRSFSTGDGNHDIKPVVCKDTANANIGSLYSKLVGSSNPRTGIPSNVMLFPRAVESNAQPGQKQFGNFASTGEIGAGFSPFVPGTGGNLQNDMKLKMPLERIDDRRSLLSQLDALKYGLDNDGALNSIEPLRRQAYDTILRGVAKAFDVTGENPKLIEEYDTSKLANARNISPKWNNFKNYVDNGQSLGKLMLLARRLCEAGCGFVTVTTNFVWDMHADVNNAPVEEGMQYMGWPLDRAVSAFLRDVESRGLSDKILLVVCGEMGRTPKVNAKGGRDHWGRIAPLMLAGGGLNKGHVIGQSTVDAGAPASKPYRNADLIATIMHTLFDVGQLRLVRGLPADINKIINTGEPIEGLI